ncbi:hypothetical protein C8Q77DRAFT_752121 [Trametes polyzona]|nr:hypothetical protein C8Q77DRAFT_752121 [Trametes polyzona]
MLTIPRSIRVWSRYKSVCAPCRITKFVKPDPREGTLVHYLQRMPNLCILLQAGRVYRDHIAGHDDCTRISAARAPDLARRRAYNSLSRGIPGGYTSQPSPGVTADQAHCYPRSWMSDSLDGLPAIPTKHDYSSTPRAHEAAVLRCWCVISPTWPTRRYGPMCTREIRFGYWIAVLPATAPRSHPGSASCWGPTDDFCSSARRNVPACRGTRSISRCDVVYYYRARSHSLIMSERTVL